MTIKKLIDYVDNLEKAINKIGKLPIPKEIEQRHGKVIKDTTSQLSSVVDLIDEEYHEQFYGKSK